MLGFQHLVRGTASPFVAAAYLALAVPASAQTRDSTVAMPVEFVAGRFFVTPVTTAGDTLRFYTDTGGGLFVLDESVDVLGLAVDALASETDTLRVVRLPELAPGEWIPDPTSGWGSGLPILRPRPGQRTMDMGHGMLGQAWFGGRVWTFDYPAGRLLLHLDGAPAILEDATTASLGFRTDSTGHRVTQFPRIQAVVDGDTLDFLLDTGATVFLTESAALEFDDGDLPTRATSFITTEVFQRWRVAHPDWRVLENADQTVDSMSMIEVPEVRIAGQAVGPVWFTQRPDAAFHEFMAQWMDRPVDGALGGNAFRFFRMTVDYPRARASFVRPGD